MRISIPFELGFALLFLGIPTLVLLLLGAIYFVLYRLARPARRTDPSAGARGDERIR